MSSSNGYVTPDQLLAIPRNEENFTWGPHKFRLQGLLDYETADARRMAQTKDKPDAGDHIRYQSIVVAYGFKYPALNPGEDLDKALKYLSHIPPGVQNDMYTKISGLTWRPASESWKDFFDSAPSDEAPADGASSTSTSANSSASLTPSS